MKPPPKHYPKTLDLQFAADVFDGRMHHGGAGRPHTALGLLIEILHWYRTHESECGPAFAPIAASIEHCVRREAPNVLAELKEISDSLGISVSDSES